MCESKISENKAILSLERYDILKEYEKIIKESKFVFTRGWDNRFFSLTENEFIDHLQKENQDLNKEIRNLKYPVNEKTLFEIKNMNLFSLIMWKLKNN